jgi:hypothetical protein
MLNRLRTHPLAIEMEQCRQPRGGEAEAVVNDSFTTLMLAIMNGSMLYEGQPGMAIGLLLEVTWFDTDVIQLRIAAQSESFSAIVTVYSTLDLIISAVKSLEALQLTLGDSRCFTLSATLGIEASFELKVLDRTGHCALTCLLGDDEVLRQTATVVVFIVPAAIDRFVSELYAITRGSTKVALLERY